MKASEIPKMLLGSSASNPYETMRTFSRRSKFTLITVYVIIAMLICVELQRENPLSFYVQSEKSVPSIVYKDYCVRPNAITNSVTDYDRIALILHISADYLDEKIVDQVINWDAPVSLAVYLDDPDVQYSCLLHKLRRLAIDHPIVADNLRVHFVYKKTHSHGNCNILERPFWDLSSNCISTKKKTAEVAAEYPANTIRNLARMFSDTKYILIADYEHQFSGGFEKRMRLIASKELAEDPKQLLVYRIFEIEEKLEKGPRSKAELAALLKNKNAVVFHAAYYGSAHNMPGLDEWLKNDEKNTSGVFLRNMNYTRYNWEPQFASLASIPMHDERFPYQIRDNTCLRWELCRAGYRFSLVDDLFMYHRGIKRAGSETAKDNKQMQKINRQKFRTALKEFTNRMYKFYPETSRQCPVFKA